jgi:UDP-N-acetylglucosamine 2-epimerase
MLEQSARMILTDSGGVQKEAYFFGVPCLTLRQETEWVETVQSGWNFLVGADVGQIVHQSHVFIPPLSSPPPVFGDGHAAKQVVEIMRRSKCK